MRVSLSERKLAFLLPMAMSWICWHILDFILNVNTRVPVSAVSENINSCKFMECCLLGYLTHWGRVTHICLGNLTIIGSDNGLSPGRRQPITWTNAGILLIGPLGTNFIEIFIEIHTFSFKKIHLKMSSGKWQPFCLGLNELIKISCWQ